MASGYKKALFGELGVDDEAPAPDEMPAGDTFGEPTPGNTGIAGGLDAKPIAPELAGPDVAAPPAANPLTNGSTVNLAGWDPTRTDNTGKYKFGRFAQSKGGRLTGDDVRAFVAANPDEWEIYDPTGKGMGNDPLIRQKQTWLDSVANNDPKRGQRSTWQDVIADSGPGGANRAQFSNASGDPALGFAEADAPAGGGLQAGADATGGGVPLDALLQGDPLARIQEIIAQLSGSRPNLAALMQQLGGQ